MSFKKVAKFLVAFLFIYFLPSVLFSDDIKDADKYYKSLDYRYALEIYEKVYRTDPKAEIAEKIANCYRFINNTEAAEIWYKTAATYPTATAENYKYLADALKQNGKFDEAAANYKIWGEKNTSKQEEADLLVNSCNVAKTWAENPDIGALVESEIGMNSENSDFCPSKFGNDLLIVSDRWSEKDKVKETAAIIEKNNVEHKSNKGVYGWTGNPYLKLYSVNKTTKAVNVLDKVINSGYHNGPAAVNAAADTMIFTRAVPASKSADKSEPGRKYLIMAVKKGTTWVAKDKLPFNPDGKFSVQHPALSPDGKILYFSSDMVGGYGGVDIYFSEKQAGGQWSKPQNCGAAINTSEDDVFPSVRQDGKFYFSTKGHIGMGGLDIFSANGEKNKFTDVENLRAPLNSPKDDFGVLFNDDLKTGYLSSNRNGGVGLDDIYRFTTGIKAVPKSKEKIYAVNGSVVEKGTGAPISGMEVTLFNKDKGTEVKTTSDAQGKFNFSLEKATDYVVKGDATKFFTTQEGNISTKGSDESTIYDIRFELEESKEAYTVKLNNIYYDFNKWNIRKDAVADLDKVNQFMNNLPNVRIELVAHTDSRGKADYNLTLSAKRAESAKAYLVGKGVGSDRMSAVGRGEYELLNQCSDGVRCTEAQHQLNRRTEFKIVKVMPIAAIFTQKNTLARSR